MYAIPNLQERLNNLFLLVLFVIFAGWQLGQGVSVLFEPGAMVYVDAARNFIETGSPSTACGDPSSGCHLLWAAILGGLGVVLAPAMPTWLALLCISALPLLFFAWSCRAFVFVQILIATYFVGFAMEGILAAVLFILLAWSIQQHLRLVTIVFTAMIVLSRVDFIIPMGVLMLWCLMRYRSIVLALVFGLILGLVLDLAGIWVISGEPYPILLFPKLFFVGTDISIDRLTQNFASAENMVRLGIWLGAMMVLVLARETLGINRHRLLFQPAFHIALAAFVLFHAMTAELNGALFAAPLLTAIYASGRVVAGFSWRSLPSLLLGILAPGAYAAVELTQG
ncbi:MAG: hypothetical protein AAF503_03360 [Pseudomonadota bacterium]